MRARSRSEVGSRDEAYALLGLAGPSDPAVLRAAFHAAVKAARPDAPGGDETRFRQIIAAWRMVRPLDGAPEGPVVEAAPAAPVVRITPIQALKGGATTVRLNGRVLKARIARGVRTGDPVRIKGGADDGGDLSLSVLICGDDALKVIGDDLHMTWPVSPRVVDDGGRVEIRTHAGPRSVWLTAGQSTLRMRLKDLGLPARRKRPRGHLFVTLVPSADAVSPTEDRLAAFARLWTPERLAA